MIPLDIYPPHRSLAVNYLSAEELSQDYEKVDRAHLQIDYLMTESFFGVTF